MLIRLADVIISLLSLVLLSPLLLLLALTIQLGSPGGAFYMQRRVGRHGRDFSLIKFRTMFAGSDKKGLLTIGRNDKRVTRTGIFMRRYKLDELPQLVNV